MKDVILIKNYQNLSLNHAWSRVLEDYLVDLFASAEPADMVTTSQQHENKCAWNVNNLYH